jgi:1,4-dihydroxy-2-naphthoyl-CoA hydrolase
MGFQYNRTIRFQDTDAAGVVYFANILAMCHEAYEASLAASGIVLKEFFGNSDIAVPIVHASVDFFKPLFCGDEVVIELVSQRLSDDSFEVGYQVFLGEVVMARAITRHVCIDVRSRKRRVFSGELLGWLNE